MRILVFTSIYPIKGTREGFTPIVNYFCEEWVKSGHEVVVVSCPTMFPFYYYLIPDFLLKKIEAKKGYMMPNTFNRKKITVIQNGVLVHQMPIFKKRPGEIISEQSILKKFNEIEDEILCNFKADIAIGHWINPQVQFLSLIKSKYNVKTSLVLHSVPNEAELTLLSNELQNIDLLGFRSEKLVLPTFDRLVINKEYFLCYSGVKDYYNLAKAKYQKKRIDRKNLKVSFVGNLIRRKYPERILEALNGISHVNFQIDIIGEGELEREIRQLKLNQNIELRIHGRLKRNEVYDVLAKSDVFVMISKNEAFGLVYLEAMLNRCIPIASYGEGFDGIIKNGLNGFLSEAGNSDKLRDVINDILLLDDVALYNIQENSFNTAVKMTDENMAELYLTNLKK